MRPRGKEIKGKKTKEKPKCKIYIFCEGITEKVYLQHFQNRIYNVEIIPVNAKHTDARGIVLFAKNYISKKKPDMELGDRGYCVFDCDPQSNPNIKGTLSLLHDCREKGLFGIFSNPSFEVWFVLHFRKAPHGKNAVQMKRLLKNLLQDKCPDYSESTDIYDHILPRQKDALKRARQLYDFWQKTGLTVYPSECNPYTDIFHFIDYIEKNRNPVYAN